MTRASRGPYGTTLLVIAKAPVPGRVKTRLTPHYSPQQAAALAEAALADTLATGLELPARRRVLVLDGTPGPWLPPGYEVIPQAAGGLDARLAAAFALCDGPALLIGMDTPQLTPALLAPAFAAPTWHTYDACFGPASDGGFWALGLAEPRQPELLLGVPMSTPYTGATQRTRLTTAGLRVHDLPVLRDVDTPEDATEVASLAPHTRFADAVRGLADRAVDSQGPYAGQGAVGTSPGGEVADLADPRRRPLAPPWAPAAPPPSPRRPAAGVVPALVRPQDAAQ